MLHRIAFALLLSFNFLAPAGFAAGDQPTTLRLWPGDAPATQPTDADDKFKRLDDGSGIYFISNIVLPSMTVVWPETREGSKVEARAAVIICPGGGYLFEAAGHEGFKVAEKLAAEQNVVGIVLRSRLPNKQPPAAGELPVSQQDVLRAIQLTRSHAADWHVDPQRVGVMGFSAGGHLAASAATMFDEAKSFASRAGDDAISKLSARPDFALLVYPVITMGTATDPGSRNNLIGEHPTPEVAARFSNELRVTPNTPPLFLVHAIDDNVVPIENTLLMMTAAAHNKVPCTAVIFQTGGHGFGLGPAGSEAATWFDQAVAWMHGRKILEAR